MSNIPRDCLWFVACRYRSFSSKRRCVAHIWTNIHYRRESHFYYYVRHHFGPLISLYSTFAFDFPFDLICLLRWITIPLYNCYVRHVQLSRKSPSALRVSLYERPPPMVYTDRKAKLFAKPLRGNRWGEEVAFARACNVRVTSCVSNPPRFGRHCASKIVTDDSFLCNTNRPNSASAAPDGSLLSFLFLVKGPNEKKKKTIAEESQTSDQYRLI